MKLTPKQIDFVNKQIEINDAILKSNPKNIINHGARYEALRLIAELANIHE